MKLKNIIFILFILNINNIKAKEEFKITEDDTNIIYYSEDIERNINYSLVLEAKAVVRELDVLLSKMNSFQEKQYIEDFKQKFAKKYFYENKNIEEINRNVNKILNDRMNKKLITYERQINEEQQILK